MAKTIAILNGKGGVGKTTTTINLGTALWLLGKKVLLVDADPQCNLSVIMDQTSFNSGINTLYEWMMDDQLPEAPVYERYENFDFIPACTMMETLNQWLINKVRREEYLKNLLDTIGDFYDYILIDCAPAVDSLLNINVLVASDSIIIPTRTDFFGVQAQGTMLMKVQEVRKAFRKELPILGYLLTQYERTSADRDISEYFKNQDSIKVFPHPIRKCSKCRGMLPLQMSLYEYDAYSTAADDYMMMAEHIIGRAVRPKKWIPSEWKRIALEAHKEFLLNQKGGEE